MSKDRYHCLLRINKDSSINFIYNLDKNWLYAQYNGTIKKINDTLYHISAKLNFGKFDNKRLYLYDTISHITNDTDYFGITIPYINFNDTIIIKYANGKIQNYIPYNKQNKHSFFALDKKLFNERSGSNFYTIMLKRENEITGQPLDFRVSFGSAPTFESGEELNFDVVITNNKLWNTGMPILQTGRFILAKNK